MATVLTDSDNYTAIANAIRAQLGVETTYTPSQMAVAIASISGGGGTPTGFAYYNGYLLPEIPTVSGYDYAFIRKNEQTGNYDLILGDTEWFSHTDATLDNWSIRNTTTSQSVYKYYTAPQSSPTAWTEVTGTGYNGFGTDNNRKVIWSSHDIYTGVAKTHVFYKHGIAVTQLLSSQ